MIQVTRSKVAWWLASVMVLLAIHGCGGPVRYHRPIHDEPERYVRLEARYGHGEGYGYDGAAMKFAHPVALSEADWDKVLKGVRVQLRKQLFSLGGAQTAWEEAFIEPERRYLARYLAEAFSQARPDEWVVFGLTRRRDPGGDRRGGPEVTEMTSGGFFIEGEQLRLLLANYRYAASVPFIREQIRDDPLRPAGDALYELVPGRHQAARAVHTINTELDLTKPIRAQLSELVITYQSFLASPDEPEAEPGARPSPDERLRTLQHLREQGLITEEEYRLKRQKLLDEL